MHVRRTAILALSVLGTLGLAGCGSPGSSTATTVAAPPNTGGTTATTAPSGSATTTASLCGDLTGLSNEEAGLVNAQQTASGSAGSLPALQSYAKQAKSSFDQTGAKVTADLASSPTVVRSAWSTLQPQLDQVFASAVAATDLPAFARVASTIESTNSFLGSDQTLSAFIKAACPTAATG